MSDLSFEEQANVRAALRFVRARSGAEPLARALGFTRKGLGKVFGGKPISVRVVFRLARLISVPMDDLVSGKFPPAGVCRHCGHAASGEPAPEAAR